MAENQEKSEVVKREEATLEFWEREYIFEKSLQKEAPKGEFIFYEGPPTANGKPGLHHLESRAFKDAIPRYKTMRGYRVARRAGWDTHGLPVELEVERELGFSGKKDIDKFGIGAFNKRCRESVLRYVDLWTAFTKRIGYWVDENKAYFTFDAPYMEVLWHLVAHIHKEGRLYKDYKIVPWCPRCGTSLSSHELAQGYEEVKDLSVTAKFELLDEPGTFILAWTTTPWTLPGNIALAVGESIAYGKYEKDGVRVILADARAAALPEGWRHVADVPAVELIGKYYKPLYLYAKELAGEAEQGKFDTAYQIYPADFVTTEDGTGIVHTAVMYGQEDFDLGSAVGLPKVHLVSPEGRFVAGTGPLAGREVTDAEVAVEIVKDLATRGLLFDKTKYEHSYPFCWRCKTRLIYYARDSWYIRMTSLRETLVAENKEVDWEPAYIKEGRMGEWLLGAKDWAISRERYWGTPLPVWESADSSERMVIGSIDEFKQHIKKSGNRYLVMRHGEAKSNVEGILDSAGDAANDITEKGRAENMAAAHTLRKERIDFIITSPLRRSTKSAEILREGLGLPDEAVIVDQRLKEIVAGSFDGGRLTDWEAFFHSYQDRFTRAPEGAETYNDLRRRVGDFLYDLEVTYAGKTVLILTHAACAYLLSVVAEGASLEGADPAKHLSLSTGEAKPLPFTPLPHNGDYELDLHRPYVDEVVLVSKKGTELRRVAEVMDVWFDSGAMPFAQAARERGSVPLDTFIREAAYPADFISEAIDQTRGWFYTLLAVGVLMGRGRAYKHVISLGHLLDGAGQKMSKSKGNVVDPSVEIERWGVDALRLWMYSVSGAGDAKTYDERTVREAAKALSWLENSAKFYELCKVETLQEETGSEHALDRWMKVRTRQTTLEVTGALEAYKLFEASRALTKLFEDLSQWYVRRVRIRARKGEAAALLTLRKTLHTCALLLAPLAPFLAEHVYALVRSESDPLSVHLAEWPHESLVEQGMHMLHAPGDTDLLEQMERVRALSAGAHELRQKAGIKVRQPLARLLVPDELSAELLAILAEEVNVKHVTCGHPAIELDMELTPELIREGDDREMARAVAEARKGEGFRSADLAHAEVAPEGMYVVELSTGTTRFNLVRDDRDEA